MCEKTNLIKELLTTKVSLKKITPELLEKLEKLIVIRKSINRLKQQNSTI